MGRGRHWPGCWPPPLLWLVVAYLGALVAIFATAFFTTDPFTNEVVRDVHDRELPASSSTPPTCASSAAPLLIAVAGDRAVHRDRRALRVLHGPGGPARGSAACWSQRCSCRCGRPTSSRPMPGATMVQPEGVLDCAFGTTPGYGLGAVVLTLTYLWLPYMILPVYAGFERLPVSHLEASADLGGRGLTTFRRVVLPSHPSLDRGGHDLHVLAQPGRLHRRPDRRRQAAGARHRRAPEHLAGPALRRGLGHHLRRDHGPLPAGGTPHRRSGQPVNGERGSHEARHGEQARVRRVRRGDAGLRLRAARRRHDQLLQQRPDLRLAAAGTAPRSGGQ